MKKDKRINNDIQNTTQKSKDSATRNLLKSRENSTIFILSFKMFFGRYEHYFEKYCH